MKPNSHDLSPQDIALLRIFYPKPEDMGTSPFQDALRLSRIPVEVSKDWSPENVRRKYCTYMSELNRGQASSIIVIHTKETHTITGPNLYTYPEPIRGRNSSFVILRHKFFILLLGETSLAFHLVTMVGFQTIGNYICFHIHA